MQENFRKRKNWIDWSESAKKRWKGRRKRSPLTNNGGNAYTELLVKVHIRIFSPDRSRCYAMHCCNIIAHKQCTIFCRQNSTTHINSHLPLKTRCVSFSSCGEKQYAISAVQQCIVHHLLRFLYTKKNRQLNYQMCITTQLLYIEMHRVRLIKIHTAYALCSSSVVNSILSIMEYNFFGQFIDMCQGSIRFSLPNYFLTLFNFIFIKRMTFIKSYHLV